MRFRLLALALVFGAFGSAAVALTIAGVDTDEMLAKLSAGQDATRDEVFAMTNVDVSTLTLEELAALLAVLEALRNTRHDVTDAVAKVSNQIAFLATVAQDVPVSASPN